MKPLRKAFSLIEVVIAIAVVAGGLTVMLALLPSLVRNSEDAADVHTALRLPDAVHVALKGEMRGDFASFANGIQASGLDLVAEKDGSNVRRDDASDNPVRSRHFLIEVRGFDSGELAYNAGDVVLVMRVKVSWPYRVLSGGTLLPAVEAKDRQSITFNLALNP